MQFQDRYRKLRFFDQASEANRLRAFPDTVRQVRCEMGLPAGMHRPELILQLHRRLPQLVDDTVPKGIWFFRYICSIGL